MAHSTILRVTMKRMGTGHLTGILALGFVLGLNACARSGPPAPIIDRSGAYSPAPVRPLQARTIPPLGTQRRAAPPPVHPAPQPMVTKVPLAPPGRVATGRLAGSNEVTSREREIRVQRGETLYAISRRHGVPLRALIDTNGLKPPYRLAAGTRLRIPAARVYIVGQGDTVYRIARRFSVNPARLVRENRIRTAGYRLNPGQKLVLPQRSWTRRPDPTPPAGGVVGRNPLPPAVVRAPARGPRPQTTVAALPAVPAPPPRARVRRAVKKPSAPPPRSGGFQWPVRGKVLSAYGAKGGGLYNDGINIAARAGTPVRAVESGVVAYTGNELRGYGNLLLVRHSGGWVSAYAHTRKILVVKGQVVRRGQTIARVGRSGTVNRPQLHFELRRGPRAVNPLRYLGKKG